MQKSYREIKRFQCRCCQKLFYEYNKCLEHLELCDQLDDELVEILEPDDLIYEFNDYEEIDNFD